MKHTMKTIFFCCLVLVISQTALAAKKKAADKAGWNYKAYLKAFRQSGRKTKLTAADFSEIQKRKGQALAEVKERLIKKLGQADERLLKAMDEVPREYFHYNYQSRETFSSTAWEMPARTYKLGWGSALSDYQGQAYMVQLAQPKKTDTVLEIGTGSGYNVALLSRLVKKAYSIEIIKPLGNAVKRIFKPLGYTNVFTKTGDGYDGWPQVKGGFDIIIVTCAAQYLPPALLKQLKKGGRLLIPIGQPFKHDQTLFIYTKDADEKVHSTKYGGYYFIPMTGKIEKIAAPKME